LGAFTETLWKHNLLTTDVFEVELSSIDAPLSLWQKILHPILHIGGNWAWNRVNWYASQNEWSELPQVYIQFHGTEFREANINYGIAMQNVE
jgi:hypothetical protein